MNTDFLAIPDWFSYENAGAGIAVADLNGMASPTSLPFKLTPPLVRVRRIFASVLALMIS